MDSIIRFEGIITKSTSTKDGYVYVFLASDGAIFEVYSKEFFEIGSAAKVTAFIVDSSRMVLEAQKIEPLSQQRATQLFDVIENKIADSIELNDCEQLVSDAVMAALRQPIQRVAKKLLAAQKLGRPIVLRFHNDADGISGALAITSFLRCKAYQQNSAIYSVSDAVSDLNALSYTWKPLLILLDFGSNEESVEGLSLVCAASFEIIIIDHHPPHEKIKQLNLTLLTPWLAKLDAQQNEDLSKYTAGYLACEVARLATDEAVENQLERLASVACAGDKSKILNVSAEHRQIALVLDYVAAYSHYGNSLDFYRLLLKNKDLFDSILVQANEKINEICERVKHTMKERVINNIFVYILDLEGAVKQAFPSTGKITTNIFEALDQNKPILVIGHGKRSVILRLNELAEQHGLTACGIAEKVKVSMSDFVESGGGHRKAAAIKVKQGFAKDVVEEILRDLNSSLSNP
jgi:RecJ-like exonuclease